jgi:hypothetical protein
MEIRKAVLLAFALSFSLTFRYRDLRWFCFGRKELDDGDLQYEKMALKTAVFNISY